MVATVEEWFRPVSVLGFQGFSKPFCLQVVLIAIADIVSHYYRVAVAPHGIGTESGTLLWIVVLAETDAAAAYVGVQLYYALHYTRHAIGAVQRILYVRHGIDRSHIHFRQYSLYGHSLSCQHAVAQHIRLSYHRKPRDAVYDERDNAHDDEQHYHNAPRQPLGKGTRIGTLIFLIEHIG